MEDAEQSKLFVGGISWETTDEILKQHFGKYGLVIGCVIAKDRNTGSPRGFAFVTFTEASAVDQALQDPHEILGRTVEVKKAIPRNEQGQQQHIRGSSRNSRSNGRNNDQFRTKKIFVGGLPANLTEEEFRSYFEKFGRITDVVVMHDNVTHRPRGFGFITFDSEDAVEEVMQKSFHELSGKLVEVKRAVPKDGISSANNNSYSGRPGGGRGSNLSNFDSYQQGSYMPYNLRYGYLPSGYGSVSAFPYGAGIFSGSYPSGGYGGIGYGLAPVAPRSPWNSPAMLGFRGSLLPYASAPVYSSYLNGGVGVTGMTPSGYNGILGTGYNGKSTQISNGDGQSGPDSMFSQSRRSNVDVNSIGSGRNFGAAASKQSQSGSTDQSKSHPVDNSS